MPTQLRELYLPQIVEARKSEEFKDVDIESLYLSSSVHTQNSSASDFQSPVTPPSSLRSGYARYSNVFASVEAVFPFSTKHVAPSPVVVEATEPFPTGLGSLPDVKEETLEREENYDMFDDSNEGYNCFCEVHERLSGEDGTLRSSIVMRSTPDYDLTDGFFVESDMSSSPPIPTPRSNPSTLTGLANRLSTRFPSFSRRWKGRKVTNGSVGATSRDPGPSRPSSSRSRASSMNQSFMDSDRYETQFPPTPAASIFDERDETEVPVPIDVERANRKSYNTDGLATTPLLPPMMVPDSTEPKQQSALQSPLQSPTVAATPETTTDGGQLEEPVIPNGSPGIRSPPLSTQPSKASMNPATIPLIPANEIPSIRLAEPDDRWACELGHANFDIHPEPYLPDIFDIDACKQIRANWDLARTNFTKHLVRTGEHYGTTSKTYRLTEEKWAEIDAQWRKNNMLTIDKTAEDSRNAWSLQCHPMEPRSLMKIPSLNGPHSEGKFPKLGDEVIVGPMVQIASQLQPKPSRKAAFLKFFQDVRFPGVLLGRSCGGRDRSQTL